MLDAPSTPPLDAQVADQAAGTLLVLAAHGSGRRPEANALIGRHAAEIGAKGIFRGVETAFLTGEQTYETLGRDRDAPAALVVPFMMTHGFLASEIVRDTTQRLRDRPRPPRIDVAHPVGTHVRIADMAAERGIRALADRGIEAGAATLMVVAHGSKKHPESRDGAFKHVARIRASAGFADVRLAFLEEEPLIGDVLDGIAGPAAVVGLFAAPGGHAIDDVATVVALCGRADVVDAGPVGSDPRMASMALERALERLQRPDASAF